MKRQLYQAILVSLLATTPLAFSSSQAQESATAAKSKTQTANLEARANSGVDAVAKEMDLSDPQRELLQTALLTKYRNNAAKINANTPSEEKAEIWRESNLALNKTLAEGFSKKEIRQLNQIVRKANDANRIFNGKNLDGWEQVNGTATYEVIDGAIVGTTMLGSPNSFLATKKKYANFDMRFEVFLVNDELNSGVQFRSAQHTEESLEAIKKKTPLDECMGISANSRLQRAETWKRRKVVMQAISTTKLAAAGSSMTKLGFPQRHEEPLRTKRGIA
jgi:hypothetical protein